MYQWTQVVRWRAVPALLLLLTAMLFTACRSDTPRQPADQSRADIDSVFLIIDYAANDADTLAMNMTSSDTMTVLEVLTTLTGRDSIAVETKSFAMGTMIERIGNRKNGEGGYWVYTVNSTAIPAAASAHTVNRGDTIRFVFYK